MFITEEDYKVVIGDNALKVISQVSPENRTNAEAEAREGTGSLSCTPATFHFTT